MTKDKGRPIKVLIGQKTQFFKKRKNSRKKDNLFSSNFCYKMYVIENYYHRIIFLFIGNQVFFFQKLSLPVKKRTFFQKLGIFRIRSDQIFCQLCLLSLVPTPKKRTNIIKDNQNISKQSNHKIVYIQMRHSSYNKRKRHYI